MYKIYYTKQATKDIQKLKSAELDTKAKELIDIIRKNPFQNPPVYEKLLGNLSKYYSRRINVQHRLVYEILDNTEGVKYENEILYEGQIKIIRMWTHYDNIK